MEFLGAVQSTEAETERARSFTVFYLFIYLFIFAVLGFELSPFCEVFF
jgi:hypothetical protein